MENSFKKLISLVLVLAISFAMAVPAFAEEKEDRPDTDLTMQMQSDKEIVEQLKSEIKDSQKPSEEQYSVELNPEILAEYQKYIKSKNKNSISSFSSAQKDVEEFADYAAEKGLIPNTPESKQDVSKSIIRTSFKAVVTAGRSLGYTLSAECLNHSLQDSPSDVTYARGSGQSNKVRSSPQYQEFIRNFTQELEFESSDYRSTSGSLSLDDPKDVDLSLHNVEFQAGAERINGKWTIYMRMEDDYDFDFSSWSNISGLSSAARTALNNYGSLGEDIGAIVSYHITVFTAEK